VARQRLMGPGSADDHRAGWLSASRWPARMLILSLGLTLLLAVASGLLGSCTNDPFDPASVPNHRPTARLFVEPVAGDSLNPTSYFRRTFHWSGSDEDGFVVAYHVSIQTRASEPAPWATTVRSDTTMTFTTDDQGRAEAIVHLACQDDRGAMSDTISRYIPLRNFPPVVHLQADFDSVRWSFGSASFRLFALDEDGNETLDDAYLYRLDCADTNVVYEEGDPAADPALGWVQAPFLDLQERKFTIDLRDVPAAPNRHLIVLVQDEAHAEARFDYRWSVRQARGPILLVSDASPFIDELYVGLMDSLYGQGQWSRYETTYGLPDADWVLLDTFREFDAVIWYTGGGTSRSLRDAAAILRSYVQPEEPDIPAGRLLLVSRNATGAYTNLSAGFIQSFLGVSPTAAPANLFYVPAGRQALAQVDYLPDLTCESAVAGGTGLTPLAGTGVLYRMEECRTCYGGRQPFDPIVGVRRPDRQTDPLASVALITVQLEYFSRPLARAALAEILSEDMGLEVPGQ
jgi:hypothetical protein